MMRLEEVKKYNRIQILSQKYRKYIPTWIQIFEEISESKRDFLNKYEYSSLCRFDCCVVGTFRAVLNMDIEDYFDSENNNLCLICRKTANMFLEDYHDYIGGFQTREQLKKCFFNNLENFETHLSEVHGVKL